MLLCRGENISQVLDSTFRRVWKGTRIPRIPLGDTGHQLEVVRILIGRPKRGVYLEYVALHIKLKALLGSHSSIQALLVGIIDAS